MTGAELKAARERLGLTQHELGAMIGIHGVTVSCWERETRRMSPYQVALITFVLAQDDPPVRAAVARVVLQTEGAISALAVLIGARR